MIEEQIERRVLGKMTDALSSCTANMQCVGQLMGVDGVKALENADSEVIIIAKASPRSYSTSTIPTCQVPVELNVLVRADVDATGANYLDVTSKVTDVLEHWQKCYDDTHQDFTLSSEFECTGYRLDGGNFTLDRTGKTWQATHNMTVFGVVQ